MQQTNYCIGYQSDSNEHKAISRYKSLSKIDTQRAVRMFVCETRDA